MNEEIIPENINRTKFILTGEVKFEKYEIYKADLKRVNILLDEFITFIENYLENIFNEPLFNLED